MTRFHWTPVLGCLLGLFIFARESVAAEPAKAAVIPFEQHFKSDPPVARWTFQGQEPSAAITPQLQAKDAWKSRMEGNVKVGVPGPRPSRYPSFQKDNTAAEFFGDGGSIRVSDPGDKSLLDFDQGDSITMEAWVNVTKLGNGQQVYLFGKGRTRNKGFHPENQNYALRLTGAKGGACISFLFRDREAGKDSSKDFHRWNTNEGFPINSGWHHVAVSYTFGQPDSIRGVIDGEEKKGSWDYGGATTEPPVVDNDELWIGSSLGGNAGNTLTGQVDELVLHRRIVPVEELRQRYVAIQPPSYVTKEPLPDSKVLVEVFHNIPDKFDWKFTVPEPFERFDWPLFALTELPQNYTKHGVRGDRSNPLMVRMSAMVTWPAGATQLRIRTRGAAVLKIDGKEIANVPFAPQLGDGSDGRGGLYPVPNDDPAALRDIATGDRETLVTINATGMPQRVELNLFAGGRKRRPEFGETLLSWRPADSDGVDQIVAFGGLVPIDNAGWWRLADDLQQHLVEVNRERRTKAAREWTAYWDRRHETARQAIEARPEIPVPALVEGAEANNEIDHFIAAVLEKNSAKQLPLVDDWAFLRRACLDVIGQVPTPEMIEAYFADKPAERRGLLIERLLEHPGWADHWMGYWQDVLAENPNVINPTLNNTGPFRWWLHESFSDNKPFDRFATELILMEGSTHYGGPAGFSIASQNDSPMAAKAHILAQAFLGMEMKCARCHDAPYHDFLQKDLFSIAAMLNRKPLSVPDSSTIPGDPAALQSLLVKVTLKPGEPVPAEWPFAERFSGQLSTDILLNPEDRREQLAAIMTSAGNDRFNQVIVNRLWRRYIGRGIVQPVDDWESADPSHPQLLKWLARKFVESGYDMKAMARLILNSRLYQQQPDREGADDERIARLLSGPVPRRMTAEQIVDSLFVVSGKPMNVEPMNIDVDTMRAYTSSLNLGRVSRAWQLTSMSNERDRPSLSLPGAQTVVDVLETFGWRSARPDPLTIRPQETTVLQPAILANGVIGKRVTQLSDDSRFTEYALTDQPLDKFLDQLAQTILTRELTSQERQLYRNLLQDGYDDRRAPGDVPIIRTPRVTSIGVCWTNHLHPEANERKLELKHRLDRGDPVTKRLTANWRERAEDVVWVMINSPEFVFIP